MLTVFYSTVAAPFARSCVAYFRTKIYGNLHWAYFEQNLVVYSIYGAKLGQIYKYNETIYTPQPRPPGPLHPSCLRSQVVGQERED